MLREVHSLKRIADEELDKRIPNQLSKMQFRLKTLL
jgi:hypothetical protein